MCRASHFNGNEALQAHYTRLSFVTSYALHAGVHRSCCGMKLLRNSRRQVTHYTRTNAIRQYLLSYSPNAEEHVEIARGCGPFWQWQFS